MTRLSSANAASPSQAMRTQGERAFSDLIQATPAAAGLSAAPASSKPFTPEPDRAALRPSPLTARRSVPNAAAAAAVGTPDTGGITTQPSTSGPPPALVLPRSQPALAALQLLSPRLAMHSAPSASQLRALADYAASHGRDSPLPLGEELRQLPQPGSPSFAALLGPPAPPAAANNGSGGKGGSAGSLELVPEPEAPAAAPAPTQQPEQQGRRSQSADHQSSSSSHAHKQQQQQGEGKDGDKAASTAVRLPPLLVAKPLVLSLFSFPSSHLVRLGARYWVLQTSTLPPFP